MFKSDIKENTSEITLSKDVFIDVLKTTSSHPTLKYAVYVNAENGQLYSADPTATIGGETSIESATMFNQSMMALNTVGDNALATNTAIAEEPSGRVDVFVNGLSIDLGFTKDAYFSNDDGITAKAIGDEAVGDKLYWNSLIAGYPLESDDKIDFDYIISNSIVSTPILNINVSGGLWGTYVEGDYSLIPFDYSNPPLEKWKFDLDSNNHIYLQVSETSTELLNIAQVKINGIEETFIHSISKIGISDLDKRILDVLFKDYVNGSVTLSLSRGSNWSNFNL